MQYEIPSKRQPLSWALKLFKVSPMPREAPELADGIHLTIVRALERPRETHLAGQKRHGATCIALLVYSALCSV